MQPEPAYVRALLNLNEMIGNRPGVIVIGEAMTGKTQGLRVLQNVKNWLHRQELRQIQEDFVRRAATATRAGQAAAEIAGAELEQRIKALTTREMSIIRAACSNLGVVRHMINPKSQSLDILMGKLDGETQEWSDGIVPAVMRQAGRGRVDQRQWIVFDGPLEAEWVENLNSVLDDNRKLTLATGESVPLTKQMTILVESDDLSNCSPATISRCGIIFMNEQDVDVKGIINHYINNLPPVLSDQAVKFDQLANFFLPDILESLYRAPAPASASSAASSSPGSPSPSSLMFYPVSAKLATQNFLKYFEAFIIDYRQPTFSEWRELSRLQQLLLDNELKRVGTLALSGGPHGASDASFGPPPGGFQGAASRERVGGGASDRSLGKRPGPGFAREEVGGRPSEDADSRLQRALRYREEWFEAFFLQALMLSFSSLLKEEHRAWFAEKLKAKLKKCRVAFGPSEAAGAARLRTAFDQAEREMAAERKATATAALSAAKGSEEEEASVKPASLE